MTIIVNNNRSATLDRSAINRWVWAGRLMVGVRVLSGFTLASSLPWVSAVVHEDMVYLFGSCEERLTNQWYKKQIYQFSSLQIWAHLFKTSLARAR